MPRLTSGSLAQKSPGSSHRPPSPACAAPRAAATRCPLPRGVRSHVADTERQSQARGDPRTRLGPVVLRCSGAGFELATLDALRLRPRPEATDSLGVGRGFALAFQFRDTRLVPSRTRPIWRVDGHASNLAMDARTSHRRGCMRGRGTKPPQPNAMRPTASSVRATTQVTVYVAGNISQPGTAASGCSR